MRRVLLLTVSALVAAAPLVACSKERQEADKPLYTAKGDDGIEGATAEAQRTLPVFWAKYRAQAPGYSDFRLKVALPTDDGQGIEGIWMAVDRLDGDQVVGRLSNEPFQMKKLHMGSVIEVDPSRIQDWMYLKDGKAYGHFSTRVLMQQADEAQRAQAAALLAPTPLEPGSN